MFRSKNSSRKPALACGTKMFELCSKKKNPNPTTPVLPRPVSPGWFRSASSSPVCWPGRRSWVCCRRTALKAGAASSGGPPGPSLWSGAPASHLGLENTQLGRPSAAGRTRPSWPRPPSRRPPDRPGLWPLELACCVCALEACAGLTHCGGACVHVISLGKLLVQPSGLLGGRDVN